MKSNYINIYVYNNIISRLLSIEFMMINNTSIYYVLDEIHSLKEYLEQLRKD